MTATFFVGDAIEVMNKLPENSVDLVLSSPPFLALRSYLPSDHPDKALEGGSQATPGEYIDWLVDVVEACDRVLAPHGSLCIELGDTYAGSGGAGGDYNEDGFRDGQAKFSGSASKRQANGVGDDYRPSRAGRGAAWPLAKSLSLIPELFRLTLVYGTNPLTGRQTDRWRLRNVVRWVRPNPPVGALGDKFRPATSELMVFCKSAKRYFDLDAVREPAHPDSFRLSKAEHHPKINDPRDSRETKDRSTSGQNPAGGPPLDWWNIPPGGYEGAHYAVFPPELCIKPIKAMCPERVCRQCGEPSRRIVEYDYIDDPNRPGPRGGRGGGRGVGSNRANRDGINDPANRQMIVRPRSLGFSDCGHSDYRPGMVLDPFVGSGTTLMVATGHGRDAIGIDLDERNYELALERVGPFILDRAL